MKLIALLIIPFLECYPQAENHIIEKDYDGISCKLSWIGDEFKVGDIIYIGYIVKNNRRGPIAFPAWDMSNIEFDMSDSVLSIEHGCNFHYSSGEYIVMLNPGETYYCNFNIKQLKSKVHSKRERTIQFSGAFSFFVGFFSKEKVQYRDDLYMPKFKSEITAWQFEKNLICRSIGSIKFHLNQ